MTVVSIEERRAFEEAEAARSRVRDGVLGILATDSAQIPFRSFVGLPLGVDEWSRRWGLPAAALDDLARVLRAFEKET
jgi:hypothetical protein